METKKKKKSDFSAISINRIVAERFREYSKKTSKSHTLTLELMMDFFEGAKISPKNTYLMNYMGMHHYFNKRMDYIEELLKNWDKNSPIHNVHRMLSKLFEYEEKKEPEMVEIKFQKLTRDEWNKLEEKVSKKEHDKLKEKYKTQCRTFLSMLEKIKHIEPRFGKPYYKIETDATKVAVLKQKLQRELESHQTT